MYELVCRAIFLKVISYGVASHFSYGVASHDMFQDCKRLVFGDLVLLSMASGTFQVRPNWSNLYFDFMDGF